MSDHREYIHETGRLPEKERTRYREEIRTLLRED
ncbi:MAG: hypothetical protein ABEN55_22630, partial [Bradymonadaceae bacterium]